MKIKVSEATPTQLDWLVAKCEGHVENGVYGEPVLRDGQLHIHYCGVVLDRCWVPTTDWSQGGPIIESEAIQLIPDEYAGVWTAYMTNEGEPYEHTGPTPLIAAMRCFVASKLGDEVEVPNELS
jgi:hypothetical protein